MTRIEGTRQAKYGSRGRNETPIMATGVTKYSSWDEKGERNCDTPSREASGVGDGVVWGRARPGMDHEGEGERFDPVQNVGHGTRRWMGKPMVETRRNSGAFQGENRGSLSLCMIGGAKEG
ncbi:hypothetical protein Naga_100730g2 [Nannochloropsis gaditana]|uniref:Uncharacterized protein n=1 Tax=Nannochloropsis gaditana TaxID=72520 RepID=W7TPB8_9STRA|nr:hypothetical protein Naga_100730g2 [Nannochloropsis gaditana]